MKAELVPHRNYVCSYSRVHWPTARRLPHPFSIDGISAASRSPARVHFLSSVSAEDGPSVVWVIVKVRLPLCINGLFLPGLPRIHPNAVECRRSDPSPSVPRGHPSSPLGFPSIRKVPLPLHRISVAGAISPLRITYALPLSWPWPSSALTHHSGTPQMPCGVCTALHLPSSCNASCRQLLRGGSGLHRPPRSL